MAKMINFWGIVNQIIADSDILLLILDSRMIDETRHPEIEKKITNRGKKIIYVLNKCDLVKKSELEFAKEQFNSCVFLSSTKHLGTNLLRQEILKISRGEYVTVGVLGYPNVGKSSVINALAGKGSAPVGNKPGYTRGIQKIRVSKKIAMLDSPGVLPYKEGNDIKHLLIGSLDPNRASDPDLAAEYLIEKHRERILKHYLKIEEDEIIRFKDLDEYDILEKIAEKLNCFKKKAIVDIRRASIRILLDWQRGKIN
jgi:ribosome biogenesis GTPase A